MGFPRFKGAVRNLIVVNAAIFVLLLLLRVLAPGASNLVIALGALTPEGIEHGFVWQFLTYGFLHLDPFNFVLSMLGVYFIGSAVEDQVGSRRFIELYLSALVGAGILGFVLSLSGIAQGAALGSGPAANAILMVFYFLYREARVMPMFIPIPIPIKYIVIFTAAIEAAYFLLSHYSLFMAVQLLGLGMGYTWYSFARRRSAISFLSVKMADLRNNYYRWKRRRAGKKFQVYMRKHQHDPKQYFDEYGNFKPPEEKDKRDRGPGGWVN